MNKEGIKRKELKEKGIKRNESRGMDQVEWMKMNRSRSMNQEEWIKWNRPRGPYQEQCTVTRSADFGFIPYNSTT